MQEGQTLHQIKNNWARVSWNINNSGKTFLRKNIGGGKVHLVCRSIVYVSYKTVFTAEKSNTQIQGGSGP